MKVEKIQDTKNYTRDRCTHSLSAHAASRALQWHPLDRVGLGRPHISLRSFSLAHLLMTRIINSACGLPAFECSIENTSRKHSRFSLRRTKEKRSIAGARVRRKQQSKRDAEKTNDADTVAHVGGGGRAVNAPSGQHCLQHTRARAALAVPKFGIAVELFEQIERLGRKVKGAALVAIVSNLHEQVDLERGEVTRTR